jgi:hypothetical protein
MPMPSLVFTHFVRTAYSIGVTTLGEELRGECEFCGRLRRQITRGGKMGSKMNILNTKFDFLLSTIFKILGQIKVNLISSCDFLMFRISVKGSHCNYSSRAQKNPIYATVQHKLQIFSFMLELAFSCVPT